MMQRLRMMKIRKHGSLVCAKCKAPNQFALWEGGVCRRCFGVPVKPVVHYSIVYSQLDESDELRRRCDALMKSHGLNKSELAGRIGIDGQRFRNWYAQIITQKTQARVNAGIRAGLDRIFGEVAA